MISFSINGSLNSQDNMSMHMHIYQSIDRYSREKVTILTLVFYSNHILYYIFNSLIFDIMGYETPFLFIYFTEIDFIEEIPTRQQRCINKLFFGLYSLAGLYGPSPSQWLISCISRLEEVIFFRNVY